MEEDTLFQKQTWGKWLESSLSSKLEGTGLRPEVEYIPPVYDEVRVRVPDDEKGKPGREMKMIAPEKYRLTIISPLEWKVENDLSGKDISPEKADEIVSAVLLFHTEAYPEKICSDYMYDIFRRVPGKMIWITEKASEILYRVTFMELTRRFGPRSVKGITMYEDLLVVHTKWAGDFYIGIDDYRKRLEEVSTAMTAFMRKPLRHKFLYELRHGNANKKKD